MRIGGADVICRLRQCCDDRSPAVVLSLTNTAVCNAQFTTLTQMGDRLELEFISPPPVEFEPLSLCCVSYVQAGRGWLFVTSVREFWLAEGDSRARIALRAPECLTATEARQSLRIPIVAESGLDVAITGPSGPLKGIKPIDISLGGMLVKFGGRAPKLPIGTPLRVDLRLGGDEIAIEAVLQRFDSQAFGLRFPAFFPHDSAHLPETYRNIVRALEKRWLRERRATHRHLKK